MSATKKRKHEDGEPVSTDQVMEMISLWDQDQLRKVLAKLGVEHPAALNEIKNETEADPRMRKIFVRNLAFTTTDQILRSMFEQYGTIQEAVVIMDKMKGQSKGFGFVTFEAVDGANACLEEPTKNVDGRSVYVNLAAQRGAGGSSSGGSSGPTVAGSGNAGSPDDVELRKLFVRSLSYETTSEQLKEFFMQYGEVSEAVVLVNRDTGTSKGYGFVTMGSVQASNTAMMEPTKQFGGRSVYVKVAASNEGRPPNKMNAQYEQGGMNAGGMGGMNQMSQMYGMNQMYGNYGAGGMGGMPAGAQAQYGAQAPQQAQYGAAQAGYGAAPPGYPPAAAQQYGGSPQQAAQYGQQPGYGQQKQPGQQW